MKALTITASLLFVLSLKTFSQSIHQEKIDEKYSFYNYYQKTNYIISLIETEISELHAGSENTFKMLPNYSIVKERRKCDFFHYMFPIALLTFGTIEGVNKGFNSTETISSYSIGGGLCVLCLISALNFKKKKR